jgi:hypothetical protein
MKSILPRFIAPLLAISILASCQSFNSAVTPGVRVAKDDFDGATIISQDPVCAASSMREEPLPLGFSWNSSTPDKVYLTAGVVGIQNVFGLAFNVGGRTIVTQTASLTTEYGPWSTRRFMIDYNDFETIATAPLVKMKVSVANSHGVCSFGTTTNALVGKKLPAFLQQVRAAKGNH